MQVKAGNGELPRGEQQSQLCYPPKTPHCSLSCSSSHICCHCCRQWIATLFATVPSCHLHLFCRGTTAYCLPCPSFKTSSTLWEACCRAGIEDAGQSENKVCLWGWGRTSTVKMGQRVIWCRSIWQMEPCWARRSTLDWAESGMGEGGRTKKHDIKKETSPTSGRKPVPQQGSVASGHPTRPPTLLSAPQIQS